MPVLSLSEIVGFDEAMEAKADTSAVSGIVTSAIAGAGMATLSDIIWTNLGGKPSTFTPSTHNHDGVYAPTGHNHAGVYQPVGAYLTTFGYATGNGGTITQATNKSTAVTLNKPTGEITMNAAALAAGAIATFVLNNSALVAGDMIATAHHSGGTIGPYLINARGTGAGVASISVRNTSAGSLSEAIVVKFAQIKAVNA